MIPRYTFIWKNGLLYNTTRRQALQLGRNYFASPYKAPTEIETEIASLTSFHSEWNGYARQANIDINNSGQ